MNHQWQQPIRPLEVQWEDDWDEEWIPVVFIRPDDVSGWEVICIGGTTYHGENATLRVAP